MESVVSSFREFYLKDLFQLKPLTICVLALLFMLGFALFRAGRQKWNSKEIAYAALCIAISFALSCIRLYRMPSGGSVVLCSILPLIAFAYYAGIWQGILVGVAYGLMQILQGAWIVHPIQGIADYLLAYAVLALGALIKYIRVPERIRLPLAVLLGGTLRWLVHTLSGVVFFAQDAIDAGQLPFIYSALYNTFLFPEMLLSALIALSPGFVRVFAPLKRAKY